MQTPSSDPVAVPESRFPVVRPRAQRGASAVGFIVVAPVLLLLGLGTAQIGLIYHGKTILNYAAFEAARAGAVHHAMPEPMRRELAFRLAPLAGGDGSAERAALAIGRSMAVMESPVSVDGTPVPSTGIEVLSPPAAAFEDWGVFDPVSERRVIPNSHLRHRRRHAGQPGDRSGLTLADANLLEIEVTHGLELKVPVAGRVLLEALKVVDPDNASWYEARRLPLRSVATVRMQSDVWLADAEPSGSAVPDGEPADGTGGGESAPDGDSSSDIAGEGEGEGTFDCDVHGLLAGSNPVADSTYNDVLCAGDPGFGARPSIVSGGDGAEDDGSSSPVC